MYLELHQTSGLGVRPARASASDCDTTRSQYSAVSGTTSSGTPAASHTCAMADRVPLLDAQLGICWPAARGPDTTFDRQAHAREFGCTEPSNGGLATSASWQVVEVLDAPEGTRLESWGRSIRKIDVRRHTMWLCCP